MRSTPLTGTLRSRSSVDLLLTTATRLRLPARRVSASREAGRMVDWEGSDTISESVPSKSVTSITSRGRRPASGDRRQASSGVVGCA